MLFNLRLKFYNKVSSLTYDNSFKTFIKKFLFFLITLPLRIKYIFLLKSFRVIPTRHIVCLDILIKLTRLYKPLNINFFLTGGSALGAVRQQGFVGRPSDIDLGLTDDHFKIFSENFNLMEKTFFQVSEPESLKEENCKFNINNILVDISIYSKKKIDKKIFWTGEKSNPNGPIVLSHENLSKLANVKLYNYNFFTFRDYNFYLEKIHGKSWKIPNKKQFFWKKNFY